MCVISLIYFNLSCKYFQYNLNCFTFQKYYIIGLLKYTS